MRRGQQRQPERGEGSREAASPHAVPRGSGSSARNQGRAQLPGRGRHLASPAPPRRGHRQAQARRGFLRGSRSPWPVPPPGGALPAAGWLRVLGTKVLQVPPPLWGGAGRRRESPSAGPRARQQVGAAPGRCAAERARSSRDSGARGAHGRGQHGRGWPLRNGVSLRGAPERRHHPRPSSSAQDRYCPLSLSLRACLSAPLSLLPAPLPG